MRESFIGQKETVRARTHLPELWNLLDYEVARGVGALEEPRGVRALLLLEPLVVGVRLLAPDSCPEVRLLLTLKYHLRVSAGIHTPPSVAKKIWQMSLIFNWHYPKSVKFSPSLGFGIDRIR